MTWSEATAPGTVQEGALEMMNLEDVQGDARVLSALLRPSSDGSYTAVGEQDEGDGTGEGAWYAARARRSARHMNRAVTIAKRLREGGDDPSVSEAEANAREAILATIASRLQGVETIMKPPRPTRPPPPLPASAIRTADATSLISGPSQ